MKIDGGCQCGQISYEAEIDPRTVRLCHCTDCQVSSGSAFRILITVPAEKFTLLSGRTKSCFKIADSGRRRALVFCPDCGTQLYGASDDENPALLSLRVGTARQRDRLHPALQIWRRSALDWVDDVGTVDAVPKQGSVSY